MHKSLQLLDKLIFKLETNLGLPHKELKSSSTSHDQPHQQSEEKKENPPPKLSK